MNENKQFLSQAEFCELSAEQRNKLRDTFGIKKSGQVKVITTATGENRLVSDGTETSDLMVALNLPAVLKFLGKEFQEKLSYDFDALFQEVKHILFNAPSSAAPTEQLKPELPKESPKPQGDSSKKIVLNQKEGKPKRGRPQKSA